MTNKFGPSLVLFGLLLAAALSATAQQEKIVRVDLAYREPGNGPTPDFSPYGTQVKLSDLPMDGRLPEGAARPASEPALEPRSPFRGSKAISIELWLTQRKPGAKSSL